MAYVEKLSLTKNRTSEACIDKLIRKCFQQCLILAYANLWLKKNIPLFYKHVAYKNQKNGPETTLLLLKASGKSKVEFIIYLKDISRLLHNGMPVDTERQRYYLRTPCCLVPVVFTFFYLLFVHNDCVYRHTYELFVPGTIRLLVSNRVVNLFPLRCL